MGCCNCAPEIVIVNDLKDPVIAYAAGELARCLSEASDADAVIKAEGEGIRVGLMSDFADIVVPEVADSDIDDAVYVQVNGLVGTIAGINPRSVLLAVYKYLHEVGCRWVRPGKDGEYIPELSFLPKVSFSHTASYRHRAVCIEGAVSIQHVCDMVDWLPKVGFNGYFIQFREAHTFFERWYNRVGNPIKSGERVSVEDARKYTRKVAEEVKKRGLLYHKVGHGWTCEPFGLSGLGWEVQEQEVSPEISQYLALLDGERKLFGGIALNTNLCYSNPEVRRIVNTEISNYAADNPEVDYLHFWLADASNNNCECDNCRKLRPSDWYVLMLNELDEQLTRRNIPTKIVFLVYVDLLWAPVQEVIKNRDRFVLMFAPITRTYSQTFGQSGGDVQIPEFTLNKLEMPRDVDVNLAMLRSWQQMFPGDSFDFDYHLMWDHLNDPGHADIARLIAQDMKGLKLIGLHGYVSCQIQRIFLPTALAMTAMGQTLWDDATDFDALAKDYFAAAFGGDGHLCWEYLSGLTRLFDPVYMRGEKPDSHRQAAANFAAVQSHIEAFRPIIRRNLDSDVESRAKSWFYLQEHADITASLASALQALAEGDKQKANQLWVKTKTMAFEKEEQIHPVFDAYLFTGIFDGRFMDVPPA